METRENDEETLIFRYDRKKRLENAPQSVKDFYSGNFPRVEKGLFRSILGNKTSKTMFFTVIFLFGLTMLINVFGPKENVIFVDDLRIELKAFRFEDKVYCTVEIPSSQDFINREEFVYAKFSIFDANNNLISTDFDSGIYSGEKAYFRCTFIDYEIKKVECELDFCDKINILKSDVK